MKPIHVRLLLAAAIAWGLGCSSDSETPVGSSLRDDGLIQSRPGDVFRDTVVVSSGDTSFVTKAFYTQFATLPGKMTLGRRDDFEKTMLVRFDFRSAKDDTAKTVIEAELFLPTQPDDQGLVLDALFFELLDTLKAGSQLTALPRLASAPIPDGNMNVDRVLQDFPRRYPLPPALVAEWIDSLRHSGMAIVLNDATIDEEITFARADTTPSIKVLFSDTTSTSYKPLVSGTFVTDLLPPTGNLRLSDGETSRIFLPVDLSVLDEGALLHDAKVVLHIDTLTSSGGTADIELYVPNASTVGDPGMLTAQEVVIDRLEGAPQKTVSLSTGVVELPVRAIVAQFLADSTKSLDGFVVRYLPEGNAVRRFEFFGSSAADTLRPFMWFTFSRPPTFP